MTTENNMLPRISVVIPTFNRAELLAMALDALCRQTLPMDAFEAVVVDDGSTDDTERVVASFAQRLPVHYARQANAGISAAKNHGLALSRAPIVVFLDDDDVTEPDYLAEHLETHERHPDPHVAVLGFTDLLADVADSPLMGFVTGAGGYLFSYRTLKHGETLDFSYFWGGRSSCKRLFLLEHGVFNPDFRFGAEDIELGYRLSRVGLRVVFNRQAVSHMVRALSVDDFLRRCYRQGRSNWVFSRLHPERVVRDWTQVDGLETEWRSIAPRYADVVKMVRDLDRLASQRARVGLPLDAVTLRVLHRAYHAAFRAARIKGSVDMKRGSVDDPALDLAAAGLVGDTAQWVSDYPLPVTVLESYPQYLDFTERNAEALVHQREREQALTASQSPAVITGYCAVCEQHVDFAVKETTADVPSWREDLWCPLCGLNNRMRAAVHLFDSLFEPTQSDRIYVTEQLTPMYTLLKRRFPRTIGSEFLGDEFERGGQDERQIRHEDLTELSFDDQCVDYVLSFDVLEHVPNYRLAFGECLRVLRPGGRMLFSVPFIAAHATTSVRARVEPDGSITHLLPPEYHGDPVRESGCLAFYHYGWDLLDELREIGFEAVEARHYWSEELGYLGPEQLIFTARRPL